MILLLDESFPVRQGKSLVCSLNIYYSLESVLLILSLHFTYGMAISGNTFEEGVANKIFLLSYSN